MDKLVYIYYPILLVILLWGAKVYGKKSWNEECFSLSQTKALQGFFAICILFHHLGQKTCAPWLFPGFIRHGLDIFVKIGYWFVGIFLFCSGYGLFKSFKTKPNYLKGFFRRRILPLIAIFYSTAFIFLGVRYFMGQQMSSEQIINFITGKQLCNPNAWFVIALPIFYLGFYFSFRFIKNEKLALFCTCLVVFLYTLIGTRTNHNDYWMRGEWWYNSAHFFILGLLFARHEKTVTEKVKRHYIVYVVLAIIAIPVLGYVTGYAQNTFSYYGENMHLDHIVLRRWVTLLSQMAVSCAFVFLVFMLGLKIKIGNKVLAFMGTITLEFYIIQGLFVELFGYSFLDLRPSLYYIKNVALFVLVVTVCSVPAALLLHQITKLINPKKAVKKKQQDEKEIVEQKTV